MAIAAGDIFRQTIDYDMPESQPAQNILAFRCESGACTEAELLTAMATFVSDLWDNVDGILHNNVTMYPGTLNEVVWSGTEWVVQRLIGTPSGSVSGTDATDMLPHAVSAVISFPTDLPRKFGKIFLPGVTEANQADSLLVAGAATALGLFAVDLRTAFTAGTASFLYRVLGKGGLFDDTTGFNVNGVVGSQRRRKPE